MTFNLLSSNTAAACVVCRPCDCVSLMADLELEAGSGSDVSDIDDFFCYYFNSKCRDGGYLYYPFLNSTVYTMRVCTCNTLLCNNLQWWNAGMALSPFLVSVVF